MSNDNTFKVGDVVELKSGGPDMTITAIENGYLKCTYWNADKKDFGILSINPAGVNHVEN